MLHQNNAVWYESGKQIIEDQKQNGLENREIRTIAKKIGIELEDVRIMEKTEWKRKVKKKIKENLHTEIE